MPPQNSGLTNVRHRHAKCSCQSNLGKGQGHGLKLTSYILVVPRLRMLEAVPPHSHMFSWLAQRQLYLYHNFRDIKSALRRLCSDFVRNKSCNPCSY